MNPAAVHAALAGDAHTVFHFPCGQPSEERARALGALPSPARAAIACVLAADFESTGYDADVAEHGLEFFLVEGEAEDGHPLSDIIAMSEDWQLSVTKGEGGSVLYDFNGRPGDNQSGGDAVVAKPGEPPRLVFLNRDEGLQATKAEYAEWVKAYEGLRPLLHSTGCELDAPPPPAVRSFATEQAFARYKKSLVDAEARFGGDAPDVDLRCLVNARETLKMALAARKHA
jgi:hypothetical protein